MGQDRQQFIRPRGTQRDPTHGETHRIWFIVSCKRLMPHSCHEDIKISITIPKEVHISLDVILFGFRGVIRVPLGHDGNFPCLLLVSGGDECSSTIALTLPARRTNADKNEKEIATRVCVQGQQIGATTEDFRRRFSVLRGSELRG